MPVHLSFHDPFVKPYKLVSLLYTIVCEDKIVAAISTTIALFALANPFFMNLFLTTNRTENAAFFMVTS